MKISTKGRYALEAVLDLAVYSRDELVSLGNISERLYISKNYLEQLFSTLRKKEIVISVRGARGGYKLSRPAKEITAGDVIRAVEGELIPVSCIEDGNCYIKTKEQDLCVCHSLWAKIMDLINNIVDDVTLEDLMEVYEIKRLKRADEYYI